MHRPWQASAAASSMIAAAPPSLCVMSAVHARQAMSTNTFACATAQPPHPSPRCRGFTGLSGAGKSTLAEALEAELPRRGRGVEVLDGDVVRTNLSKGLGFSREDRNTNIRRITFVCHLLSRNGVVAISAAISPYRTTRDEARRLIGDFVESV